jgi:hypothetical protein
MFSDRYRIFKISALFIILIGLCLYGQFAARDLLLTDCLVAPAACDGREVPLDVGAKLIKLEKDRILVSQPRGPVEIMVPADQHPVVGQPGDYLAALVVFHRDGPLELVKIRVAPLRKAKIFLSVIPVVLVAVLLFRSLRWEKGGLVLKE